MVNIFTGERVRKRSRNKEAIAREEFANPFARALTEEISEETSEIVMINDTKAWKCTLGCKGNLRPYSHGVYGETPRQPYNIAIKKMLYQQFDKSKCKFKISTKQQAFYFHPQKACFKNLTPPNQDNIKVSEHTQKQLNASHCKLILEQFSTYI